MVNIRLLKLPVLEAVNVPFFIKYIDEQNKFNADEGINKAAEGMMKELLKDGSVVCDEE